MTYSTIHSTIRLELQSRDSVRPSAPLARPKRNLQHVQKAVLLLSCFRSCRGTWVGSRNLRRCCNGGVVSAGDRDVTVFGRVEGSRRRDEPHTGSSKIIARHGAAARAALGVLAIGRPRRRAPLAQERPMSLHFSHFARPLLPGSAAASSTGASMAVLPGSPPSPAPPAQANLLPRFGLNLENHSCSPPVRGLGSKRPCGGRAPSADHTPEKTLARAEVDSLFIKVLFFRREDRPAPRLDL